ncbi:hypothetical protein PoB_002810500 [Plakobranchus ocellatus]|uniref:Uncharacterized protein n=1 Tax=Plakobranchus ocellatus TaxID=259542 RepID=A0AAV4A0D6_9GAST|nr:hypothetical protein PoB_002810500 [Plakobranchus ocellatus]
MVTRKELRQSDSIEINPRTRSSTASRRKRMQETNGIKNGRRERKLQQHRERPKRREIRQHRETHKCRRTTQVYENLNGIENDPTLQKLRRH